MIICKLLFPITDTLSTFRVVKSISAKDSPQYQSFRKTFSFSFFNQERQDVKVRYTVLCTYTIYTIKYILYKHSTIHTEQAQYNTHRTSTVQYTPYKQSTIHTVQVQYNTHSTITVQYTPYKYSTINTVQAQYNCQQITCERENCPDQLGMRTAYRLPPLLRN